MFSKLRLDWLYVEFYFCVYLSVIRKSLLGEVGLLYGDPKAAAFRCWQAYAFRIEGPCVQGLSVLITHSKAKFYVNSFQS